MKILEELRPLSNFPWLVVGDFNEILTQTEKMGGKPRGDRLMESFRDALESCNLVDLGHVGDAFTRSN